MFVEDKIKVACRMSGIEWRVVYFRKLLFETNNEKFNKQFTWETDFPANSEIIDDPTVPVPGANLSRCEWCILNHFRSGAGRCAASLHQWGYTGRQVTVRLWSHPDHVAHRWQLLGIKVRRCSRFPPHTIWFRSGVVAPYTLTTMRNSVLEELRVRRLADIWEDLAERSGGGDTWVKVTRM